MDATAEFSLEDVRYRISAPTAVQLTTIKKVIGAHYGAGGMRNQMLERGIGEIDNIVDVGACIGIMSLAFNCIWPKAQILAIEPHPISFDYLAYNCRDFPVTPLRIAASNKREGIRLSLPELKQRPDIPNRAYDMFNIGMVSRYGTTARYAAEVEAAPLDELVDFKPDLIKIDVEGAELTVLEGATRLLQEHKPLVSLELRDENLAMGGTSISEIVGWLGEAGYRCIAQFFDDALFQCR